MKKLIITSILALLVTAGTGVMAQDYPEEYLGLPGDNLNLYAVMKLFQESETLEGFERNLNDENSRINNLDLNGDNLIDYIAVNDYVNGNVHTIVLRVALDRNETQDVAVFTVEKYRDGSVRIQLIGDEALYGRNYIVEPIYAETPNPGYTGRIRNTTTVTVITTTPYEVAAWPLIRFIFLPNYVIWRSRWYWGYYPPYWRPWRPYYWHYYYGYHYNWYHDYYTHYHFWRRPRNTHYYDTYYRRIRSYSPLISTRIKEGNYRATYGHPEQRRDGEALFTRTHPNQTRRTADNTVVRRVPGRSVSEAARERSGAGTRAGDSRRSATTTNNRTGSNRSDVQNSNASRRTPANMPERAATKPAQTQRTEVNKRAPASGSERAATRPAQTQRTEANRKASAPGSARAATKPAKSQRAESSSSSNRRSSSRSKASTPASKSDKSKESENKKPSRR